MSFWNTKHAILMDLSLAQGCEVPTDLECTISAGERPPALKVDEENDYFNHYFGDYQAEDHNSSTPDCAQILQLLDLVHNNETEIASNGAQQSSIHNSGVRKSDCGQNGKLFQSNLEPSSMFRKKKSPASKTKTNDVGTTSSNKNVANINQFKPSTKANEYCQQFMERSKLKETLEGDIWSRAMHIMKELETKRKSKNSEVTNNIAADLQALGRSGNISQMPASLLSHDVIRLPRHRHLTSDECPICDVFKRNSIDIDFDALLNE